MLRPLRYAPAVAFALLALAFVGLWVRSYFQCDSVAAGRLQLTSYRGGLTMTYWRSSWHGTAPEFLVSKPASTFREYSSWHARLCRFNYERTPQYVKATAPLWSLAAAALGPAIIISRPRLRFTVRGLLIATTILGAVLGLAVYAV